MADKYNVGLNLPGSETKETDENSQEFISVRNAGLIPRSVRLEIASTMSLPDAPSKKLVECSRYCFTALGEKLTKEHGDSIHRLRSPALQQQKKIGTAEIL